MASVVVDRDLLEKEFSEIKVKIEGYEHYSELFFSEFKALLEENSYGKYLNVALVDFEESMETTLTEKMKDIWNTFNSSTMDSVTRIEGEDELR